MLELEITDEEYAKLSEKIFEYQEVRFDAPYWFDEDADNSYCQKCAKKKQRENLEWETDGGFECESDGVIFCETCGIPLSHTLTDYGSEEELKHFEENGLDRNNDLVKHTLVCISGGIPLSHQKRLHNLIFVQDKKGD